MTTRCWRSGSTALVARWPGPATPRVAGRRTGWAGTASIEVLLAARVVDLPGRRIGRHGGAAGDRRRPDAAATALRGDRRHARATSTTPRCASPRPTWSPSRCASTRWHLASTRRRWARCKPVPTRCASTRCKAGATPLGRTVVLVAPTSGRVPPAGHQRAAAGGPARRHRRHCPGRRGGRHGASGRTTWAPSPSARDLWPLLLLLALLLWPLDVGIRRLSVGRRDVAMARANAALRWRAWRSATARSAPADAMLASRDRAAGKRSRAALLRDPDAPAVAAVEIETAPVAQVASPPPTTPVQSQSVPVTPAPSRPVAPPPPPAVASLPSPPPPVAPPPVVPAARTRCCPRGRRHAGAAPRGEEPHPPLIRPGHFLQVEVREPEAPVALDGLVQHLDAGDATVAGAEADPGAVRKLAEGDRLRAQGSRVAVVEGRAEGAHTVHRRAVRSQRVERRQLIRQALVVVVPEVTSAGCDAPVSRSNR